MPPRSSRSIRCRTAGKQRPGLGADLKADPTTAANLDELTSVGVGIPSSDQTTFQASLARRKGLTIAMARRMNDAYPRAIRLAESGTVHLAPLVTHRFRSTLRLRRCGRPPPDGLKVIIEPGRQG